MELLCFHFHTSPSTRHLLEAAVKSLYIWILTEGTTRPGNGRGAGENTPTPQQKISPDSRKIWFWNPWSPCVILMFGATELTERWEWKMVTCTSATVTVLWEKVEREGNQAKKAEWARGGQWYVRNAAKANTEPPLTLLSLMKSMQPTFPVQRPHQTRTVAQYKEPTPEVGSSGASAVLNLSWTGVCWAGWTGSKEGKLGHSRLKATAD